jgi:hypothetical protein
MLRYALLFLVLTCAAAQAEPVPEYALDKDFMSCMGGSTVQQDPQRGQYCNCVRDSMRGWDLDTYGAIATQESKSTNAQQVPAKIQEIAQACISKILK